MPYKTLAQERARRRWCAANPRLVKCAKCGRDRVVGLNCKACQKAYQARPDRRAAHRVALGKYTARAARELHPWYVRLVLRDRPGLPPELVEVVKRNLLLKRAAGLTNLGKKKANKQ